MNTLEYNSAREVLILKEYGRNVQKLINFVVEEADKEKRTQKAAVLMELMARLNPHIKAESDNPQRVWDHIHIMSDFKLDIEGEFPRPKPETVNRTPDRLSYQSGTAALRHYGKNIERTAHKLLEIEDENARLEALVQFAKIIKSFYFAWHKELIDDATLLNDLRLLSGGEIDLSKELAENPKLFDVSIDTSNQAEKTEETSSGKDKKRNQSKGNKRKKKK